MSVEKEIVLSFGHVVLIIYMSVCKEQLLSFVYQQGIVGHDREVEQHLVYLGVAVATYGNDTVLSLVEKFDYALRIDAFGDAVTGSVVEYVAKNEEHVILVAVVEIEHLLKRWQTSVYVGY